MRKPCEKQSAISLTLPWNAKQVAGGAAACSMFRTGAVQVQEGPAPFHEKTVCMHIEELTNLSASIPLAQHNVKRAAYSLYGPLEVSRATVKV